MPIIQRPDLVAKIRKKYDLTGPDAVSTISPELVPVVVLENLAETDPGDAVKYCMGFVASGTPTNTAHLELYNPSGSGVNVIVRKLTAWSSAASNFYLVYYGTIQLSGSGGQVINRAIGQSGTPAAQTLLQDSVAPLGTNIGFHYFNSAGGHPLVIIDAFLVPPGDGIGFRCNTAATGMNANFVWEEIGVS